MINTDDIISIEKLLNNKKIIFSKILSNSFGINCVKLTTSDNKNYIVKYYEELKNNFNSITSEKKNLLYLKKINLKHFPKVFLDNDKYLIISYINNNKLQPNETRSDLLNAITGIHSITEKNYGFSFDTQIGGLKQKNNNSYNWVELYRDHRLAYIYEIISSSYPMENSINKKIEYLIKNLEDFIPKKPKPSLLHGDLWEGNILFNDYKFVGFIDPGSFYGHNELEIAYLRWFNPTFIDRNFLDKYNEIIKVDKYYYNYEPIYQLYYSLLNVHLWDRSYMEDTRNLINKLNI